MPIKLRKHDLFDDKPTSRGSLNEELFHSKRHLR